MNPIDWIATSPGVLELPTTKFRIEYTIGAMIPFCVTWAGKKIPRSLHMDLDTAKEAARQHLLELQTMGFEV